MNRVETVSAMSLNDLAMSPISSFLTTGARDESFPPANSSADLTRRETGLSSFFATIM